MGYDVSVKIFFECALLVVALMFQLRDTFTSLKLRSDVNRVLAPERQLSKWDQMLPWRECMSIHRQHYPNSTLRQELWWSKLVCFLAITGFLSIIK
jgi:hypothetical protein